MADFTSKYSFAFESSDEEEDDFTKVQKPSSTPLAMTFEESKEEFLFPQPIAKKETPMPPAQKKVEQQSVSKYLQDLLSSSDDEDESFFLPVPKPKEPEQQNQIIEEVMHFPH